MEGFPESSECQSLGFATEVPQIKETPSKAFVFIPDHLAIHLLKGQTKQVNIRGMDGQGRPSVWGAASTRPSAQQTQAESPATTRV